MEDRGLPSDTTADVPAAAGEPTKSSLLPASPKSQRPPVESPKSGPPAVSSSSTPKPTLSLEDANEEVSKLIRNGKISPSDVFAVKAILKEHANLKEKVDKLKSLLGRSAKAQRETKVDLDASQKRLSQALREIERLNQKLDKLQSRPTHCKFMRCYCYGL